MGRSDPYTDPVTTNVAWIVNDEASSDSRATRLWEAALTTLSMTWLYFKHVKSRSPLVQKGCRQARNEARDALDKATRCNPKTHCKAHGKSRTKCCINLTFGV